MIYLMTLILLAFAPFTHAATEIPQDGDTCFSPEEHCDEKLIHLVQSAEHSIDIAIYDINLDQLAHQLLVKSKTATIRILVDQRQSKEKKSAVSLLAKAGINIRYGHQRGIMHNKFTIVDNKIVETGSFNYTNHASIANNENQIYLASAKIVRRYHDRFEKIWGEGKALAIMPKLSSMEPSDD